MDIYVVLTGRKFHGKDSVADLAISKYGNIYKFALADWFKKSLSDQFNIPLDKFYNSKDSILEKPLILTEQVLSDAQCAVSANGYLEAALIPMGKWKDRQICSLRELMIWFGAELVRTNCGGEFHCKVTDRNIQAYPRNFSNINIIFITDARFLEQSQYWKKYEFVYPVKVVRPGSSNENVTSEREVDEFPAGYFFTTIMNDGSLEDLGIKVDAMLQDIKLDVKGKLKVRDENKVDVNLLKKMLNDASVKSIYNLDINTIINKLVIEKRKTMTEKWVLDMIPTGKYEMLVMEQIREIIENKL